MTIEEKRNAVPLWERVTLTLEEAAAYTGIGVNKLREMSDQKSCDYVMWVGNRRMLKRKKLEEYLINQYSV
ncbi:MAG: excisionase family DNA-binding protein [Anaerolineaceae bacterium]|nr:excisionase family DNA-binding protein [Anaerolineaceae bacterium]